MTTKTADKLIEEALDYVKEGEYEHALRLFYLCEEEATQNPLFCEGKATALFCTYDKSGELNLRIAEEIITLYKQALELDPQQADPPYLMLGMTYKRKAELEVRKRPYDLNVVETLLLAEETLRKALVVDGSLNLPELDDIVHKIGLYRGRMH